MATKADIRQILTDIRKGSINPVYLLIGPETYFIDLVINALEKYAISEADRDFNYNLYYGNETNAETVVNCAQQFPVMAPRKLVIVKETQAFYNPKADLDKFCTYVSRPNATTVLVVTYTGEKVAAISNLKKAAGKNGAVILECNPPRDRELPSYVKDYCQQHKIGIDEKAITMLCDYVGGPLSKLYGELDKLIQIKSDTKRITPEDVENHIGVSKDFNNFELVNAIRNRDYPQCMRIVNYFRNNPKKNPTVVTAATIYNFFTKITVAHFLPTKDDASLMELLDFKNSYALRDLKTALRSYPPVKAVNAIHHLREFDAKNKGVGSMQNEYDLLQELIFKIMT